MMLVETAQPVLGWEHLPEYSSSHGMYVRKTLAFITCASKYTVLAALNNLFCIYEP